jgi:hypothetical protein
MTSDFFVSADYYQLGVEFHVANMLRLPLVIDIDVPRFS